MRQLEVRAASGKRQNAKPGSETGAEEEGSGGGFRGDVGTAPRARPANGARRHRKTQVRSRPAAGRDATHATLLLRIANLHVGLNAWLCQVGMPLRYTPAALILKAPEWAGCSTPSSRRPRPRSGAPTPASHFQGRYWIFPCWPANFHARKGEAARVAPRRPRMQLPKEAIRARVVAP